MFLAHPFSRICRLIAGLDFELECEASDDYLNFLRLFDVTLVTRTTLCSDALSPLLIYFRKGERVFARVTSKRQKLIVVESMCLPGSDTPPADTSGRSHQRKPQPAQPWAHVSVTELSQEPHRELCRNLADLVGLQYRSD